MIKGENINLRPLKGEDKSLFKRWLISESYIQGYGPSILYSGVEAEIKQIFSGDYANYFYFIVENVKNKFPLGFVYIVRSEPRDSGGYSIDIEICEKSSVMFAGPETLFTLAEWLIDTFPTRIIHFEILSSNVQMLKFVDLLYNYLPKEAIYKTILKKCFFCNGKDIDKYYVNIFVDKLRYKEGQEKLTQFISIKDIYPEAFL